MAYGIDPIGTNFRGTPPPPKAPAPPGLVKQPAGAPTNLFSWMQGHNTATIGPGGVTLSNLPDAAKPAPKPVSAPPRPNTTMPTGPTVRAPMYPRNPAAPTIPGYSTQPVKPAVSQHPQLSLPLPQRQWQDPRPQQYNPQVRPPQVRPPQGFGGGGYPQLPGGNNQPPPWMQYMNFGPQFGEFGSQFPGANAGFGGGVGRPQGAQSGMGYFNSQWQSPFQGPRYQQPMFSTMPTLPNTPTSPQLPSYYRPGAMPW